MHGDGKLKRNIRDDYKISLKTFALNKNTTFIKKMPPLYAIPMILIIRYYHTSPNEYEKNK